MEKFKKSELNNLKYYISEKERLLREIDIFCSSLSNGYKSQDFTEPRCSRANSDAMLKIISRNQRIEREIEKRAKKVSRLIIRCYRIIDKIKDQELKAIVEFRSIKGFTWEHIGEEIHMDPSYARKKYIKFINEN